MLVLKKFNKTDIQDLLRWISNTDNEFLIQFAGRRYNYPLDDLQLKGTMQDGNTLVFKATEQATGLMVGHCQLMKIDTEKQTASIGRVLIKPEKRSMGYGYAMLKCLIEFAGDNLNLRHLNLRVFDFNRTAHQCYLKLGFTETKREEVFFDEIQKTWVCLTMEYSID